METILKQVEEAVFAISDPTRIKYLKTMIPTSRRVAGVMAAEQRKILKELRVQTNSYTAQEKIKLGIGLVETDVVEIAQMAYEYVGKDKITLPQLSKADLTKLNRNPDNWANVDALGVLVYGKAWRIGILTDEDIIELTKNPIVWQRRLALVSTVPLNQEANGGKGDPNRTLLICRLLINDHHDMIVKAMSWALRVLSKREPDLVRDFLQENLSSLHKRVIREVNNKLNFGVKNIK